MDDSKRVCQEAGILVTGACFGAMKPPPSVQLPDDAVASVHDLSRARTDGDAIVIDVRDPNQYSMCALPGSVSYPLRTLLTKRDPNDLLHQLPARGRVFVVCRRGNDSKIATMTLRNFDVFLATFPHCRHVNGGLLEWATSVDPTFPTYE